MPPQPTVSQSRPSTTSSTPYTRPPTSNAHPSTSTSTPTPSNSQTKHKKKRKHLAPIDPADLPKPDAPTALIDSSGAIEPDGSAKESRRAKKRRNRSNQSTATEGSQPPILDETSLSIAAPTLHASTAIHTETPDDVMKRLMAVTTASTSPRKRNSEEKGKAGVSLALTKVQIMQKRDDNIKLQTLQRQMARMREEKDKEAEGLRRKVRELEEGVEKMKETALETAKVIDGQEKLKETLKEGVTCNVCFETYHDPHILSCGHIACKNCLVSWFKTPGAYVHELPDPLPDDLDTSHRTKLCHVCRSHITRRPARMYHLRHILEPLGIDSHIPTASQELTAADDVWTGLFPVEKEGYRLRDDEDGVARCPECFGEVAEGSCQVCGVEFSEDEDEVGDWESGLGSDLDDLDEMMDAMEGEGIILLDSDQADGGSGGEGIDLIIDEGEIMSESEDAPRVRGRNDRRDDRGENRTGVNRGRRNVPIQIQNVIDDMTEESEDGDRSGSELPLEDMGRYAQGYEDDDESGSGDEEESYEGSFIDDEEGEDGSSGGGCDRPSTWMDTDLDTLNGGSEDDEEPEAMGRRARRRGVTDEEAESPVIRRLRPGRRRAPRITSDSE